MGSLYIKVEIFRDERLDQALLRALKLHIPDLSRSALKQKFKDKEILKAGKSVAASYSKRQGRIEIEVLNFNALIAPKNPARAEQCFLPVAYQDKSILVLNKTSGIPSIPLATSETGTAVNAALASCPLLSDVGDKPLEAGAINRLDSPTSGLIVFAKTNTEYKRLKKIWKTQTVKIYRAICLQRPNIKLPFEINAPIIRLKKTNKKVEVPKDLSRKKNLIKGDPLEALTIIQSIRECQHPEEKKRTAYDLTIQINTGVMHQIRAHLSSIGCPILGDDLYQGKTAQRLWLHSWQLTLPLSEEPELKITAQLPPGWPT